MSTVSELGEKLLGAGMLWNERERVGEPRSRVVRAPECDQRLRGCDVRVRLGRRLRSRHSMPHSAAKRASAARERSSRIADRIR